MTAAFAPAPQMIFRPQPVQAAAASAPAFEAAEPELATVHYLPSRQSPNVYRVRRMALGAFLVALLVGIGAFVSAATASSATTDHSGPTVTVMVQPGDTLWGIAKSLEPGADPRELVSQLTELAGSNALTPGQQLAVPAEWLD